jgi:hypothetical protein
MNIKINDKEKISTNNLVQFNLQTKFDFELDKSENNTAQEKYYSSYPGLDNIIFDCKKYLEKDLEIVFNIGHPLPNTCFDYDKLFEENKFDFSQIQSSSSIQANPFGSLLTHSFAGQKILGSFSGAYIEARAMKEALPKDTQIDHLVISDGIYHLDVLDDAIRAFDFCKNDIVAMVIPENAIKAFRRTRFSGWQTVETRSKEASIGKIYLNSKEKTEEITLSETEITNLDSPIYKVKIGERWILVAVQKNNFENLLSVSTLRINNSVISSLEHNNFIESIPGKQERTIETSPGQAIRAIFALLNYNFDLVPEALLNFEGGSWSSIATEKASSGRYCGTNSMYEVLKHRWYEHPEVSIPWNYLSFDYCVEPAPADSYTLSFKNAPHVKLQECPQYWKKVQQELLVYISRFVYRELSTIGSKKFLLSTKDLILITTKYLAELIKSNLEINSENFKEKVSNLNIPNDLKGLLKMIGHLHLMNSSKSDFYSSKKHPKSMERLINLKEIEKLLEKLCPASAPSFKARIKTILTKDPVTEGTSLLELYLGIR